MTTTDLRINTYRLLRALEKHPTAIELLEANGMTTTDLKDILERSFEDAIDANDLIACDTCGAYHRFDYSGPCDDPDNIFVE